MLKTLQTLPFLLAFTLLGHLALAQGTITGTITTDEGATLPGASVLIKGTTIGTVSDAEGEFKLSGVEAGKQTVEVSFIGYNTTAVPVNVKANSTANIGTVILSPDNIQIEGVEVIASFVRDRYTPVAVSTIEPYVIAEKLGNQEFPELMKATPSVYATKAGGGFGDSRFYLRGFDSNNIGVLINGVPVNDMESGKVYWSNWAGLSDVTKSKQVQRGLGASKIALSSVGGTVNIITNSHDAEAGGSVYYGVGNDGYTKMSLSLSTGLLENGWAVTALGSHVYGDNYAQSLEFDSWNYFINVTKVINTQHRVSFTAFGAPQTHNQRFTKRTLEDIRSHPMGRKWNPDFGYKSGEEYNISYNYYHKPQLALNHYWDINENILLATTAYASVSNGGGRRVYGPEDKWLKYNADDFNKPYDGITKLTPDGYFDFDAVMAENKVAQKGSQAIIANSINSHDWYGILSTLNANMGPGKLTFGFDGRYYKGYHAYEIEDLLGGDYFLNSNNKNRPADTPLHKGDYINYYNLGEVSWGGLFAQYEYISDKISGFLSTAGAINAYRRTDYFAYTPEEGQRTDWINFATYNFKGGASYMLTERHQIFGNAGYISRAPYFSNAFKGFTNDFNEDAKNETIITFELGYGFANEVLNFKINAYHTKWLDKGLVRTIASETYNIPGMNALHKGIELEGTYSPIKKLNIKGMISVGDWRWMDDVKFEAYNENQVLTGVYTAYIKDNPVGNAAQTTAFLGINYEVLPKLKVGLDGAYYGRNYAEFDPTKRTNEATKGDPWQMPDAFILDFNASYKFKMGNLNAIWYGNVANLMDTEYVTDALDGITHDEQVALTYIAFGRTWSTGLKINF